MIPNRPAIQKRVVTKKKKGYRRKRGSTSGGLQDIYEKGQKKKLPKKGVRAIDKITYPL
jgi:hypothetical protein